MQPSDAEPHAYLRSSLWAGRVAFGPIVLTLSVKRGAGREQPSYLLANRVATLRREHHLSRLQLARRLSIHPATLVALEEGRYQPSLSLAMHIGELFNLPVEAIFFFPGMHWYAKIPIAAEE